MTFDEAMQQMRRRKTVSRGGRTLRLYPPGLYDVGRGRPTEVSDEDRASNDWEVVTQPFDAPLAPDAEPEPIAPEAVDDVLHEEVP